MLRSGFGVSERRACRVLKQPRATQRYAPIERDDEKPLTRRIIELASAFGRYGYQPPAPEAIAAEPCSATLRTPQQRRATVESLT